jgi:tetratricopeptide (TPR) repeat protein
MIDAPMPDEPLRTARERAAAGAWAEVRALLHRESEAARASAELTTLLGEALLRTGHTREARSWLDEALPRLERSGDRAALRRGVNLAGAAGFELGDVLAAEQHFGRALELGRADGDDLLVARATNNLGAIADLRGQRREALALFQLALPAYQRLGHPLGLAQSWHNMAIAYRHLGEAGSADECELRAIEFAREAESRQLAAMAQVGRAELCLARGDAALAAAQARLAARDFAEIPDPAREADALRLAGTAALVIGDLSVARDAVDRAVSLAEAHGNALIEAEARRARAAVRAKLGDTGGAREDALRAAASFERLGMTTEAEALRAGNT